MPDNVSTQTVAPATLPDVTKIATDQLAGGEHVQFIKVMDGTLDSANKLLVSAAGGASVEIADGKDVTLGALADAKVTGDTAGSVSAKLRGIIAQLTAKGTQSALALAIQALHDAGRNSVALVISGFAPAATSEAMITTMQSSLGCAAATTGLTTYTVTTGKTFRAVALLIGGRTTTGNTTRVVSIIRLRAAVSGAITTASALQLIAGVQSASAANDAGVPVLIEFEDTMEFPSGFTLGFSCQTPGWVATTAQPMIDITLLGYEY